MFAADKPPLDEVYLEHYGVKGMKWGQRKKSDSSGGSSGGGKSIREKVNSFRNDPDASGVSRRQAREQIRTQNRTLNRNLEDFERASNRSQLIRTSRGNRVNVQRRYEDYKSDIKSQRRAGTLGKNQARVLMNQIKNERYANIYKSESKTAGEQFIEAFFAPPQQRTA